MAKFTAKPQKTSNFSRPPRKLTTIFDLLLIRAIALAAAGRDYEIELATARQLATTLERGAK